MYTSDTKKGRGAVTGYLAASAAVLVCSLVYEHFSHGVLSAYMLGAFLVPLLGGALPRLLSAGIGSKKRSRGDGLGKISSELQLAAVATATTGCFIKGVLDIYGTTNGLLIVYPVAGCMLAIAALLLFAAAGTSGRANGLSAEQAAE